LSQQSKSISPLGMKILKFVLNNKALLLLIIAFFVSVLWTGGNTISQFNLTSLMRQIPAYAIMAIGYTVVFTTGQFDMSAGSILSLCTIMFATWSLRYPLWIAICGVIVLGIIVGILNGTIIRIFNLNPFVLTLATGQIIDGIAGQITGGANISGLSDGAKFLGQRLMFNTLPVSFIVAIVIIVLAAIMLSKTLFGRHLVATGANLEAAKVSGIKTSSIRIAAYGIIGVCAGVTSVILSGRLGMGSPTAGITYTLDCIAAVIIGGTAMKGGKPKVGGSLFGMGLIVVINNMLSLLGIGTYWQMVSKGMIIAVAIILDSLSEKFATIQRIGTKT